jgi:trans-aconitate 2-methyltransferase
MSGSPAGQVIGAVATLPRFQDVLTGVSAPTVAAADNGVVRPTAEYIERLTGLGCRVDAWETVYQHVLPGDDPVLEWFRGTGLRPYLDALDPARRDDFTAEVAEGLRRAYPRQVFGTVLPFRRVFVVAHRPA